MLTLAEQVRRSPAIAWPGGVTETLDTVGGLATPVIAGDWAYCRGREHFTATPFDGGPPVVVSGRRALSILRKGEDGIWRFARGISNDGSKPS